MKMSTAPRVGPPAGPDEVEAELDAMQAVGLALSHLPDPKARARVLRWATERFELQIETPSGPVAGKPVLVVTRPIDHVTRPIDQSMTLEGVHEMFDTPVAALRPANLHLEAPEPALVSRDAAPPQNIHREAADTEPLDSLMRGLATDFQRFAIEWQRA
jgi:hypothetical protein